MEGGRMKEYIVQRRLKLLLYDDKWWDVDSCNSLKKAREIIAKEKREEKAVEWIYRILLYEITELEVIE